MAHRRTRILSDIHYGEGSSRVRRLADLEPLFDGADQIIFNGDTVETRFLDLEPETREAKAEVDAFAAGLGTRLTLVTGNHDPDISAVHHLDLEDGAVLVTHGDTLFPDLAPWGWEARHFRAEQERRLAATPEAERGSFATRLRVCKEAVMAIRHLSPRFVGREAGMVKRWIRFARRAARFDRILPCWWQTPARAAELAATYRPEARVVIIGHTHWPGVWRRDGRVVINTGAFAPPFGARVVDIVDGRIEVRGVRFGRGGMRLGKVREVVERSE